MTSQQVLAILAIAAVALPTITQATEHIVGDDEGWTRGFNYTAWAEGRDFRVGDTLVFNYPVDKHNVFKVSGHDFQACKVPPANESLSSGNDVITLATAGRKWYICGKGEGTHCMGGQKLVITVLPVEWPAPAPAPCTSVAPEWPAPVPASLPPPEEWPAPVPASLPPPEEWPAPVPASLPPQEEWPAPAAFPPAAAAPSPTSWSSNRFLKF